MDMFVELLIVVRYLECLSHGLVNAKTVNNSSFISGIEFDEPARDSKSA